MFWKTEVSALGRRPLSLALRLTVWYALCAFALIFVSSAVLYQVLAANEAREDTEFLGEDLANVRMLLDAGQSGGTPKAGSHLYLRVLDGQGRTLLETPGMSRELPPPGREDLRTIGASQQIRGEIESRSGKPFQMISAWSDATTGEPRRLIQIAGDRAREERLMHSYRERLAVVLVAALAGSAALGFAIARLGLTPLRRIGAAVGGIGQTNLHERIATAGLPAELRGLATAFNTMLDRLQEAFTRTARFSDDVAHELRTPIGNLRGEIEVALNKPRSVEDYRETLGSCLEECGRITRMVERLLFLARTDAAVEPLAREAVEVARELGAVHEFYEAAAAEAGVRLELVAPPGLTAPLDRTLFQQAVGNLISNAIAHTPRGGAVRLEAVADGGALRVSVIDTGRGIEPEHLPHVFERFYRADPARSGANAGLGLAVVKSILERHGGSAGIASRVGAGTTVELVFPSA